MAGTEDKIKRETVNNTKRNEKYIVAIGASAGGLEAIHEFFDHMPQSTNFSFIVIQHLSSDYKSLLVELVAKHTHMKVFEAAHDMTIQADCVYIIPNNKLMTVRNGRLKLADKSLVKAPNTAIDTFLHTLASDRKDKAIAIILSGTGTDGTKGIQSIKEYGGMVICQTPSSAKFDGMPNSAIASGCVDHILEPSVMNDELFNYVHEEPVKVLEHGKLDEGMLDEIFKLVHEQSGNNFNLYKTPTIIRRIGRRMNENKFSKLEDYVAFLHKSNDEVKTLGQDFLIGVTQFFRDKEAFDFLEKQILPELISGKANGEGIKIWVCACSTGQEAYSIAILLNECLQNAGKNLEVKIFATDIDEKSIEIASKNQYPNSIRKEIPSRILKKYFVEDGNFISVIPEIRKQVVFAKHDVTKSPPFIKNDMVTCRNMLIYVNNILQDKILSTFHFSLNPDGYLFLGSSETANGIKQGLTELSSKWKIFKKSGIINYATFNTYNTQGRVVQAEKKKQFPAEIPLTSVEKSFNKFITNDLGYVGVFIDKLYMIQEAVGNYRQFLELPDTKIELNILKMVPKSVSIVLNTALRKSWKDQKKVHLTRIRSKKNGEDVYLNISIQPPNGDHAFTMIVFGESMTEIIADKEDINLSTLSETHHGEYVFELEAELNETRTNLQMAVEEMETTNEELQSSNEELLSANEELQSSNEELQSLNEELHTLNTEHQLKIKELVELNDDLDNYFRSTDIGQVFLDSGLFIRKFNPAAISMVNMIDADIGRSIEHISNNIQADNLIGDIRSVLYTGHVIEKEVLLKNGNRSLMRILPYMRKDRKTDGVVITFIDISTITELNNIIAGVYNASLSAILAFTAVRNQDHTIVDFKCISFNVAALKTLGRSEDELRDAMLVKQLPELVEGNMFQKYIQVAEQGNTLQMEFRTAEDRWFQMVAVRMSDGFAATLTDITERKSADQKLKKNYNELITAREHLKALNAELEEKVQERTQRLTESEERFNQVSRATNDTIWDWNLVDNTMWRSESFTAMFGYTQTEENSSITFWFDKIHTEDQQRVRESVYEAINSKNEQWSAEYRLMKANGDYAVILDRGTILQDDFQTPYRMIGSMIDITRLVDTENKLSSSERKFRKVFDSNVIGMLFSNIETGRIDEANDAFLKMIGYTQEDIYSSDGLYWNKLTPEEYMPVSLAAIQEIKQHGVCPPFEKQYLRKNGDRISVMLGSAFLYEDNKHEVVTYIIDITEQKQAERRRKDLQKLIRKQQAEFYSIFKNAPALISIRRGKSLKYEFVNTAFVEFNGDQEYIGKSSHSSSPGFDSAELQEIENKVLNNGETFVGKALQVERKDPVSGVEKACWFDLIFAPVYSDFGDVDGIAFFGFDVTDLVLAQESTKELMHKKDEFMSIASHELKTPITSIKGYLQIAQRLAERSSTDSQILGFVDKANRQVGKLTTLVEDLLDVTRIQAGKMQFNFDSFGISELISECIESVKTDGYEFLVESTADVVVYADRHRIEQVINNFLSNAIKYSPGERKIQIRTAVDDGWLKVIVKDSGIGIPDDKKDFVFDRFFRVQESSFMFSGLGLGLYISAEIIKRHAGHIGVDSVENEGSEFWFSIPISSTDKT